MAKSSTCVSKRTGMPLSEYATEKEAQQGADFANAKHGNDLAPYNCSNCGLWHLSPKRNHTPSTLCDACTDRNGSPKALYQTQKDAINRSNILMNEQGVYLDIYPCPHNHGWHLTKG